MQTARVRQCLCLLYVRCKQRSTLHAVHHRISIAHPEIQHNLFLEVTKWNWAGANAANASIVGISSG